MGSEEEERFLRVRSIMFSPLIKIVFDVYMGRWRWRGIEISLHIPSSSND